MKLVMTIAVAILVGLAWYVPHPKKEAVNACRFEVAKKWNNVLDSACIQTWSPFYNNDGKNSLPTCDEMATAEKFMAACMGVSGFSMAADDCAFYGDCYRRSMPLQIFDSIAENDLTNDSRPTPWKGYIWNSKEQRYEWVLNDYKTVTECQSGIERSVGTFSYTRPVAAQEAERLGLTTATLILRMARLEIDRAEPDEVESMPRNNLRSNAN